MRASRAHLALACLAAGGAFAGDLAEIKTRGVLKVLVAADELPETFSIAEIQHILVFLVQIQEGRHDGAGVDPDPSDLIPGSQANSYSQFRTCLPVS